MISFKHDCKIHGHRFSPRYHLVAPEWMGRLKSVKMESIADAYERHYVGDICERCGGFVSRPGEKPVKQTVVNAMGVHRPMTAEELEGLNST